MYVFICVHAHHCVRLKVYVCVHACACIVHALALKSTHMMYVWRSEDNFLESALFFHQISIGD